jgi:hypothetical protein
VLTTQLVQVDANSTVKYLYDVDYAQTEQSLLTTSLDCNRYPGGSAKKVIDYADASNSNINLLPHVGAYGVLFRKNSDDSVVALTKVETEFLTGRFMFNLNDTTAGTFQTVDGTSYTLGKDAQAWANAFRPANLSNLTPGDAIPPPTSKSAIFINGSDFPGLTNDQSDAYVFFRGRVGTMVDSFGNTITVTRGSGDDTGLSNVHDFYDNVSAKIIVAAKVSGKTVTDILSLSAWDASPTVATSVGGAHFLYEAGQISADGKKFNGHEFPLDVNNEVDHSEYVLNGIDSLDDLSADNVVYIYKNKDGKIARIDVGTATQSGTVTNVNFTNYSRTIGGTTLYTAPWAGDNREGVDTAGNEGVALLDVYGRIYDFQLGESSKGNFAVLLNAASYFDKQVKIFDKTGSEVIYGIKDNITWTTTDTFITDTKAIAATATKPAIPGGRVANFNDLIEYKLSGSKLDVIPRVGESLPVGSAINPSGTILSISGTPNKLIDSGVVVYVRDGGDYSLGSIKDILDKKLTKAGQYIEEDGKVKALIVDVGDTGAQSVFVMITSIADASGTGGVYSYVNGLSFADGISGEIRSWDYTNHDLIATTPYNATVDYPTMVKFTIAADGVLKNSVLLKNDDTNGHFTLDSSGNYTVARPLTDPRAAIENASFVRRNSGQGGTFSITYTTTGGINTVAFEANAVIYKVDGRTWKAERPTTDVFEADKGTGVYIFLKTDKDKAYDVIIKTN